MTALPAIPSPLAMGIVALAVVSTAPAAPAALLHAQTAEPVVPQEFDWWAERGVPLVLPWGQAVDTAATRRLLSWTTAPEFTNPLVDHLPYDPQAVSPADHWGYPSGRPGHLHRVDEFYDYYEALAESSPRVRMEYLNETEEGNRFALIQVGSEGNLARLEEIREAYQRLADPRRSTETEAESLIQDLPVIHTVFTGLHSRETGHPEVSPELAYRLAVSDHPMIREIRDNVVLFIVPVTDPDGRNRVVDWYRLHDNEDVSGPPFWGKYIRHDNNRDGIQMMLRLTEQVVELFETWKYPVALDLHESFPFMFVSTGYGNPNYDPITRHEWHWMGQYEVVSMTALGMPGVWATGGFDAWNPGYMIFVPNNRNAVGRFYETFGNSLPTTMRRTVSPNFTSVEWHRANPPYHEVIWSLRNNINYAQTGTLHSLHLVAVHRERVLRNYRAKAENSLRRGRTEAPFAYVVPVDQERKADAAHLLTLLDRKGIEVHRAREAGFFGGTEVRAGDYVVRMDQPYRNFIKMLMEVQRFREDFPTPIDDVAWTLPLIYNVTVHEVENGGVLDLPMDRVTGPVTIPGSVRVLTPGGTEPEWWAVRYAASSHALQARYELPEANFHAAQRAFDAPGAGLLEAGTWLIPTSDIGRGELEAWTERYGLEAVGLTDELVRGVPRHAQDLPRIAILHSWRNTQDDGSLRWAFDRMGIPYTYLPEDQLREGGLRDRFDVILFPDQGRASASQIFHGVSPDRGPIAYTHSPEYPSLGFPSSSRDITGGMGHDGLSELRRFVEWGGTLLALGSAATLPLEFGFVRGASLRDPGDVYSPGSIVQGRVDNPLHPIAYGYEEELPLFNRFGPYLTVSGDLRRNVVVRYALGPEVFLSGLVQGRDELGGQPAVASFPVGEGHVVVFGSRVFHRHQTQGSFALAWNAILNWNHLDLGIRETPSAVTSEGGEDRE